MVCHRATENPPMVEPYSDVGRQRRLLRGASVIACDQISPLERLSPLLPRQLSAGFRQGQVTDQLGHLRLQSAIPLVKGEQASRHD